MLKLNLIKEEPLITCPPDNCNPDYVGVCPPDNKMCSPDLSDPSCIPDI